MCIRDRAIVVNEQTCIGCKLCAVVCPFGAIHPSGTSTAGVAGISYPTPTQPRGTSPLLAWSIGVYTCAVKCDLCSTLGPDEEPHCVEACPTKALYVRDATTLAGVRKDKMLSLIHIFCCRLCAFPLLNALKASLRACNAVRLRARDF